MIFGKITVNGVQNKDKNMRKIMFNDKFGLTEKVLLGQKTMTTRFIPESLIKDWLEVSDEYSTVYDACRFYKDRSPFKIGEVVAIAQSYKNAGFSGDEIDRHPKTQESRGLIKNSKGWNNKMFVRSEAMPHHIKIVDVKVRPLQEITEEEAIKEGINAYGDPFSENRAEDFSFPGTKKHYLTAREAFGGLIDKMSAEGVWKSNPCVYVYTFEKI